MNKERNKKGVFNDKRGDVKLILWAIIQIMIPIIILLLLLDYIGSVNEDTLFEKIFLSRDLGLLMDTIYSGHGDLDYEYRNKQARLELFRFEFREQQAKVGELGSRSIEVGFPFGEDLDMPYPGNSVSGKSRIIFSKSKDSLSTS